MAKSLVPLLRNPGKGVWIDPDATAGAIIGVNVWLQGADGTLTLYDPTKQTVAVSSTTPSGTTTAAVAGTPISSGGGSNSGYSQTSSPATAQTNYDLDLSMIAGLGQTAFPTVNYVLVGDGTQWVAVPMTGDATIVASGATLVNQAHLTDQSVPTPPADGLILRSYDQQGFSVAHVYDAQGNAIELTRDGLDVVRNVTGSTLTKGTAVYISGTTGTVAQVSKAKADSATTMPAVGVLYEDIANNAYGRLMASGHLENFNLSGFSAGDTLYVSAATAGLMTATKPATYPQAMGYVVNNGVGNGVMHVAPNTQSVYNIPNASLANMAAHTVKANITGGAAAPVDSSLSAILDAELGNTDNYVAKRVSGTWTAAAEAAGSSVTIITETGTTRTAALTDSNALIDCTNASGCTITIPPQSSVAWTAGAVIYAQQSGAAQVTFAAGAGVTFDSDADSNKTRKVGSIIGMQRKGSDSWTALGDMEYQISSTSVQANATNATAAPTAYQATADAQRLIRRNSELVFEGEWVTAGGTGDAITATISTTQGTFTLQDGMLFGIRATAPNTIATPTLALNGGTARNITKFGNQTLAPGDIFGAGNEMLLRYVSATPRFELLNPSVSSSGSAGNAGSPYAGKYHPDRPPSGIFADEEFLSNTEQLSWSWGTQGGASVDYQGDSLFLVVDAASAVRTRFIACPNAVDFIAAAKLSMGSAASATRWGMCILSAGTISAPTEMYYGGLIDNGASLLAPRYEKFTSTTTATGGVTVAGAVGDIRANRWYYVRFRYVASTKVLSIDISGDGIRFSNLTNPTLTNDPTYVGLLTWPSGTAGGTNLCNWFRVRTDVGTGIRSAIVGL